MAQPNGFAMGLPRLQVEQDTMSHVPPPAAPLVPHGDQAAASPSLWPRDGGDLTQLESSDH